MAKVVAIRAAMRTFDAPVWTCWLVLLFGRRIVRRVAGSGEIVRLGLWRGTVYLLDWEKADAS